MKHRSNSRCARGRIRGAECVDAACLPPKLRLKAEGAPGGVHDAIAVKHGHRAALPRRQSEGKCLHCRLLPFDRSITKILLIAFCLPPLRGQRFFHLRLDADKVIEAEQVAHCFGDHALDCLLEEEDEIRVFHDGDAEDPDVFGEDVQPVRIPVLRAAQRVDEHQGNRYRLAVLVFDVLDHNTEVCDEEADEVWVHGRGSGRALLLPKRQQEELVEAGNGLGYFPSNHMATK